MQGHMNNSLASA